MKKKYIDLQLFAEDTGADGAENQPTGEQVDNKPTPKYTDEDVNNILNQKFAEWQKKQEKKVSEAERLSKMTAEEKAAERLKGLEARIAEYETREARAAMTKEARAILQDENIVVNDELLGNLIAEDAEKTKASVENFVKLFKSAVEKAVKEALKGETPRKGAATPSLTKEQILAVANRAERQRLIKENIHLFQ